MKGLKFLALAVVCLVVFAPFTSSQPLEYLEVVTVSVKPGTVPQFENYIKKIVEAANKVGVAETWVTNQIELGRPANTYIVTLQFDKWAERDAWTPYPEYLAKAFGDAEAAKIMRTGEATIQSLDTMVLQTLPELSVNLEGAGENAFYWVRRDQVKPSMVQEYRIFISKVKEAEDQVGDGRTRARRVSTVGPVWTYSTAIGFDKWSERDLSGPTFMEMMNKTHGEAETAKLLETVRRCITSSDIFIVRMRPDLSRTKSAGSTTD